MADMMKTAGGGMPADAPPSPMAEDGEAGDGNGQGEKEMSSVFIPKDALGEKNVKPGDTITLTVKAVDPETGEVEAECNYEDNGNGSAPGSRGMSNERPGYESAIDSMPS